MNWCLEQPYKLQSRQTLDFNSTFSSFSPLYCAPLCIVETMLGHHYQNVDKSQQLVNYVEDYLECVESLPLDIQRNVSLLREIDAKYQGIVVSMLCLSLQVRV